MPLQSPKNTRDERALRLERLLAALKKMYPVPKSELVYETPMQFAACVIMSAQFTDVGVNRLTQSLWNKYRTVEDFAATSPERFAKEIDTISYFNSKAKYIVETARIIRDEHDGIIPKDKAVLMTMPGIGSKTANVILGELYGVWEGIAVDVHVKRFVYRFDLCDSQNADVIERVLCEMVSPRDWKYVNNGFVMYGRHICKARRHDCTMHPLTSIWPASNDRWLPSSK
jgi:endonuclease-3